MDTGSGEECELMPIRGRLTECVAADLQTAGISLMRGLCSAELGTAEA